MCGWLGGQQVNTDCADASLLEQTGHSVVDQRSVGSEKYERPFTALAQNINKARTEERLASLEEQTDHAAVDQAFSQPDQLIIAEFPGTFTRVAIVIAKYTVEVAHPCRLDPDLERPFQIGKSAATCQGPPRDSVVPIMDRLWSTPTVSRRYAGVKDVAIVDLFAGWTEGMNPLHRKAFPVPGCQYLPACAPGFGAKTASPLQ